MIGTELEVDGSLSLMMISYTDSVSRTVIAATCVFCPDRKRTLVKHFIIIITFYDYLL